MSVIDNNTLLYLRGDSYYDSSPNKTTIANYQTTIEDGCFSKGTLLS